MTVAVAARFPINSGPPRATVTTDSPATATTSRAPQ
jgi:hypothetical protein